MNSQKIGYVRVSTGDQNTERQLMGIDLDKVFEEKVSGKNRERPELESCIEYLRSGDVLYVHTIDRLARNLLDLQNIIKELTAKGVSINFVKNNLEFSGDDNPMSVLMLQMLGAFAEFHRTLIKNAQREGIALAKEKGVYKGKAPISDTLIQNIQEMNDNKVRAIDIASTLNISLTTVYKYKDK